MDLSQATGITIGGTVSGAGNLISGNSNVGVLTSGDASTGDLVAGNRIGTDLTGTLAIPNYDGVQIQSTGTTIGGTVSGAANLISGNEQVGVLVLATSGVLIAGNEIGTNLAGTGPLANQLGISIELAANNTIGGSTAGAGNLISGNTGDGVLLAGPGTTGNLIEGSLIGTDITGNAVIANGTGVEIDTSASGNTIGGLRSSPGPGLENVISGNDGPGVYLNDTTDNLVEGDYIGTDVTGTLALPNNSGPDQTALSGGVKLSNGSVGQHDRRADGDPWHGRRQRHLRQWLERHRPRIRRLRQSDCWQPYRHRRERHSRSGQHPALAIGLCLRRNGCPR